MTQARGFAGLPLPLVGALLLAAAAQLVVLGLRTFGYALLGAGPAVDALLAAAGLFGVALGAFLPLGPRALSLWLAIAATVVALFLLAGADALLVPLGQIPLGARTAFLALALGAVVAPIGALLPSLFRAGVAAHSVYRADLVGAALGIALAEHLAARVGVLETSVLPLFGVAAAALLLPRGGAAAPVAAPRDALAVVGAAVAALAVGAAETALPRALAPAVASGPLALPATLVGVLLGGAIGVSLLRRVRHEPGILAAVLGLTAALTILCLALIPAQRSLLIDVLSGQADPALRTLVAFVLIAALAALPALGSGAAFGVALSRHGAPAVVVAATSSSAGLAVLGAAFLLDGRAPEQVLAFCAIPAALAAVATSLVPREEHRRWTARAFGLLGASAGILLVLIAQAPADPGSALGSLSHVILHGKKPSDGDPTVADGYDLTGRTTVTIGDDRVLYRDGKPDASELGDIGTQTFLGVLPLLYLPDARNALVIGLGSGRTAEVLAEAEQLSRVDVVEFSPRVIDAYAPRLPPRVRVIAREARSFLIESAERYDIITAEPTNLFVAGMPRLISVEAVEAMRRRLSERGVLVLWTHGYLSSDELLATLLRTARAVFPEVHVYRDHYADVFLVASQRPLRPDLEALAASVRRDRLSCWLASLSHVEPAALLRRRVELDGGEGPLERDLRPRVARLAGRALLERSFAALPWLSPAESPEERLYETALFGPPRDAPAPKRLENEVELDEEPANDPFVNTLYLRLLAGPLTGREMIALLSTEEGRSALDLAGEHVVVESDPLDPPWAGGLLAAYFARMHEEEIPVGEVLSAARALVEGGCGGKQHWRGALSILRGVLRRLGADGRDLALALVEPSRSDAFFLSRAELAAATCLRLFDEACCDAVNNNVRARLGQSPFLCELPPP